MNFSARLDRLRRTLPRLECDALVISHLTNVRYLCGFTGTAGMVLVTPETQWFLTDFRYATQAAQQVEPHCRVVIGNRGLWREAAPLLRRMGAGRVGFEAEHTSVAAHEDAAGLLKKAGTVPTRGVVEKLRQVKDADELAVMQRAAILIDECFAHICGWMHPGQTEQEVAEELARQMVARGASGPSFTTIVASGERGAMPHGVASGKELAAGEMVTIDMGALLDGYCSDFTRTVCLGKASARQREIYEIVWRAQTAAAGKYGPGTHCRELHGVAQAVIADAGNAEAFQHGLGHGLGMDIHEDPRISPRGKGRLKPGMVVSCEPGIYLEDWGGVRIEDILVITDKGTRNLTGAPKPRKLLCL